MQDRAKRVAARCYFDVISPFAYLHFAALDGLRDRLQLEYVPVLFAGLLKHWGQKGPAEILPKRNYTYRHVIWQARQQGVRFRMPPRHPFNPLGALRLIAALGAEEAVVRQAFEFVFAEGRDVSDAQELAELGARLGVDSVETLVSAPAAKQRLLDNTAAAIADGVFGVPTVICSGQLFWGNDSLGMLRDFLDDPQLFDSPEMRRVNGLPGTQRAS